MEVQAAARLVRKGLGHHREDHAALFGQRLGGQLEEHQVVGAGQALVEGEVDLVLAVRVLMVQLQHVQPASRQRLVQGMQETGLARQRLQVVGGLVQPVAIVGRAPLAAFFLQQEELGLDAGFQHPAAFGQAHSGPLKHLARAAVEGLAIDIAAAHRAGIAGHPRHGLDALGIGPRVVLGPCPGARQARAPDRRSGEAGAGLDQLVQLAQGQVLALGHAVQVGELGEQGVHALRGQALLQVDHPFSPAGSRWSSARCICRRRAATCRGRFRFACSRRRAR